MNTSLADIQDSFQERMLTGKDNLSPHLAGGKHIGVYDHAYRARLLNILADDFPALHSLLGDEQFGDLINGYLDAHPSKQRSVRWLGAELSAWLKNTAPWDSVPVAFDMAAFEWALGLSFDAPDADVLTQNDLAAIAAQDWPGLRFGFHPAVKMLKLGFDVTGFQQAVAHDEEPFSAPEQLDSPAGWAVWRDHEGLNVMFRPLESDESMILEMALQGADFSALCGALVSLPEGTEAPMRAAGLIVSWLDAGWISSFIRA